MRARDVVILGLIGAAAVLMPRQAPAQPKYPERAIKLVIPFAAGGTADAIGRPWADKVKSLLGPAFVENQGGGGGAVGAAAVARAKPDGHILLLGSTAPLVLIPIAAKHAPYDPIKDFEPISVLGVTPLAIAIHPSVPAQNLKELIDFAKAHPGKLSYGSAGAGTVAHLTGELFKTLTQTPGSSTSPTRAEANRSPI
jgi:tripartite-type tricarboxylate transporter receptor subunit TctC